jgi:hypothetical protein
MEIKMKPKPKFILLLLLVTLPVLSQDSHTVDDWTFYPIVNGMLTQCIVVDKDTNNIFIAWRSRYIYKFNLDSNKFIDTFDVKNSVPYDPNVQFQTYLIQGLEVDKNGFIWAIILYGNGLLKYDGEKFVNQSNIMGSFANTQWEVGFSKDNNGDLYCRYYELLFKVTDDELIADSVFIKHEVPENIYIDLHLAFTKTRDLYFLNDKFYFIANSWEGGNQNPLLVSMNYINPSPQNLKIYDFKEDFGISYNGNLITEFYQYQNTLYLTVRKEVGFTKTEIYVFDADEENIIKLQFDALEEIPFYMIQEFLVTDDGNYIFSLIMWENENSTTSESEIWIFDSDKKLLKKHPAPVMPYLYKPGEAKIMYFNHLTVVGDDLYMMSYSHGGLIKLSGALNNIIENNYNIKFSDIWILEAVPNPVNSNGTTTIDFFCMPSRFEQLTVEVSDILGQKTTDFRYEVLNFNYSTGLGQMQIIFNKKLSKGVNFIVLSLSDEMFAKGIIIVE